MPITPACCTAADSHRHLPLSPRHWCLLSRRRSCLLPYLPLRATAWRCRPSRAAGANRHAVRCCAAAAPRLALRRCFTLSFTSAPPVAPHSLATFTAAPLHAAVLPPLASRVATMPIAGPLPVAFAPASPPDFVSVVATSPASPKFAAALSLAAGTFAAAQPSLLQSSLRRRRTKLLPFPCQLQLADITLDDVSLSSAVRSCSKEYQWGVRLDCKRLEA